MELSWTASNYLRMLTVAWPEALTIEPSTDNQRAALQELRDADLIDIWDMWPDGRRRWTLSRAGYARMRLGWEHRR
jgi:hypothetical protein